MPGYADDVPDDAAPDMGAGPAGPAAPARP
jgi:hypothetical protein